MKFTTFAMKNGWKTMSIKTRPEGIVLTVVYKGNFGFYITDKEDLIPVYIDTKNHIITEASPEAMKEETAKDLIKSSVPVKKAKKC